MVQVKIKEVEVDSKKYENVVLDCDGYEIPLFKLSREQKYIIKQALNSKELKFR